MTSVRCLHRTPEVGSRRLPPQPLARVGALGVVEVQERVQVPLELTAAREVAAVELDAPVLLQQGHSEPLYEAVRPGVPGPRAGVPDPEVPADAREGRLEFAASIGEHPLERPARPLVERDQDLPEEGGGDPLVFRGVLHEAEDDFLPSQGDAQSDHHRILGEGLPVEDQGEDVAPVQPPLLEGLERLADAGDRDQGLDERPPSRLPRRLRDVRWAGCPAERSCPCPAG